MTVEPLNLDPGTGWVITAAPLVGLAVAVGVALGFGVAVGAGVGVAAVTVYEISLDRGLSLPPLL